MEKEIKLSLFANKQDLFWKSKKIDDHNKNPGTSDYKKAVGYKVNGQKSTPVLNSSNKQMERGKKSQYNLH